MLTRLHATPDIIDADYAPPLDAYFAMLADAYADTFDIEDQLLRRFDAIDELSHTLR